MHSHGSNYTEGMRLGAGYRLRGEAAADAQHELDWVWAGRSASGAGQTLGLRLRSCTVLFLSILRRRLALLLQKQMPL